ncbi:AraC family transcriptional regulator [Thomasclavelia sp.]|uniref:AraC family transcriptional regulator n=1 Tax=Thomasclavelia sp. TaxID=3025757 RepID=UPI0025D71C05|nr:AraC family transcriptional regulator [Thomasclavelia sp.]
MNKDYEDKKTIGSLAFPLALYDDHVYPNILDYTNWHYHQSLQFCLMIEGSVTFQINQKLITFKPGQALFINSEQLHRTFNQNKTKSYYLCLAIEPRFLYSQAGSIINSKYLEPVILNKAIDFYYFDLSKSWHHLVIEKLKKINQLYKTSQDELDIYIELLSIWSLMFKNFFNTLDLTKQYNHDERLKKILAYIEKHYQDKITLKDLSDEVGLTTTYLCRDFKNKMNCQLFEYIVDFRIRKSIELMKTDLTISEIAYQCGFASSNFYIKKFKEKMKVTPLTYKKSFL